MIDLQTKEFKKIIEALYGDNIEKTTLAIRNAFRDNEGHFSVFELLEKLGIMTILHDDKDEAKCRFITFKDSSRNYLVLSACRSIEEMRFDAACMLRRLLRQVGENKSFLSYNDSVNIDKFSREDKHFACALLMPRKRVLEFIMQKDENGNYIYLNINKETGSKEISLKNISSRSAAR